MEHRLKTVKPYFTDVQNGIKLFELRKNDRNFHPGDILILEEFNDTGNAFTSGYTGQVVRKSVSYVLKDCPQFGLQDGYCVLGIREVYEPDPDRDFEKD